MRLSRHSSVPPVRRIHDESQELTALYNFKDRTVIVTGGAGVLGGEMACALVGCGANVVILDRDLGAGRAADPSLRDRRPRAAPWSCTAMCSKRDTLEQARDVVRHEFGRVDGLINGAGGNKPDATHHARSIFLRSAGRRAALRVRSESAGHDPAVQIFGRLMAQQGEGVILNVSSMNAFRPLTRIPAYSAAKAGVSNFTQWLAVHMAQEYSPRIRVNAIAPGFFLTEQNRFLLTDQADRRADAARRSDHRSHAHGALRHAGGSAGRGVVAALACLGVCVGRGHSDRRRVLGVQRSVMKDCSIAIASARTAVWIQHQKSTNDEASYAMTEQEIEGIIADSLNSLALDDQRVLVIIPDATRTMPLPLFFRLIVKHLRPRVQAVDFLVALGTHPAMSEEALLKLGGPHRRGEGRAVCRRAAAQSRVERPAGADHHRHDSVRRDRAVKQRPAKTGSAGAAQPPDPRLRSFADLRPGFPARGGGLQRRQQVLLPRHRRRGHHRLHALAGRVDHVVRRSSAPKTRRCAA